MRWDPFARGCDLDSQMHPLLREIEEQEASAPEAVPSPETPDGPVAPEAEVAAPAEESNQPEPEISLKISRRPISPALPGFPEEKRDFKNNLIWWVARFGVDGLPANLD